MNPQLGLADWAKALAAMPCSKHFSATQDDVLFSFCNSGSCYRSAQFALCFGAIGGERCWIYYLAAAGAE